MKTFHKIQLVFIALTLMVINTTYSQQPGLQYFRPNDKNGLNVFGALKRGYSYL